MKGISAFVATILLLLFAVGIGTVIFMWASGYFRVTQEKVTTPTQTLVECQRSSIRINPEDISYDFSKVPSILKAVINNNGPTDLKNFTFILETTVGKYEGVSNIDTLKSGESKLFTVTFNTNVQGRPIYLIINAYCESMKFEWKIPLD